jgi:NAD(P)-dependent dehydrogenase (short-subunit alcohol dehydrogenase family)
VALITGASAGIGLSTAGALHRAGWEVIGASRRGSDAEAWASMRMDVDDDGSVREGFERVEADHGRLDALVAGAGWGLAGPVEQTTVTDGKDQFETNFWGAVRVVRAALPIMRRQGGGRIVLISSIGGVIGIPFQAFYSASKFAVEGYGEALAYEVAPFGIEVSLVQPGNVRTDFTGSRRKVAPGVGAGVAGAGAGAEEGEGEAAVVDPYADAVAKAVGLMERDEANGVPPDDVAAVIVRLLERSRPRRRVSVGKAGERVGLVAKRLMPFRTFERAAKSSLGV